MCKIAYKELEDNEGVGKRPFVKKMLASLIDINRRNEKEKSVFDWAKGFGAGQTIAAYLEQHSEENTQENWNAWWKGGILIK